MANQSIRISLRAYDHILLDKSTDKIVKTAKSTGAIISGPIQQYEDYKTQEKKSLNFVADQNNIFEDFSRIANGLIKIGFIAGFFHFFFGEFSGRIENNKFPIEIT